MVFIHWQRSICKNQNKMVTESSLKQFSIFGNFVWLQKDRDQKMLCFAHVFYSTWTYKWGAAAEALSVSRWLSSEECREEKDWRDLQDSLLDLPPVVKGEPPGVFTDTENDLSSSNFDLVSSLAALDRNTSSLPSILSTTSPRLWTWEKRIFILKVSLNNIIIFLRNLYLYLTEHCKLLANNLFPTRRSCAQKTLLNILRKQGSNRVNVFAFLTQKN